MSVGRICVRTVDLAEPGESVQAAAERMRSRGVGTLVVLDEQRRPIGIVTDRDLTVRVLARGLEGRHTCVREVMSPAPRTVSEDAAVESALAAMRGAACRRLLVVDADGRLVGLISIDDVLELLAEEFEQIGRLLKSEEPPPMSEPR